MKIDMARPEDLVRMTTIGVSMFRESPHYSQFCLDAGKLFDTLNYCVTSEKGIAVVLRDDNDEVVGGYVGAVDEHWFGRSMFAYDYALFILPEHRKGSWSMKLIRKFEEVAKERGAAEVMLSNSTGVEPERVEKLYEFCGYERLGGIYYKLSGE